MTTAKTVTGYQYNGGNHVSFGWRDMISMERYNLQVWTCKFIYRQGLLYMNM